ASRQKVTVAIRTKFQNNGKCDLSRIPGSQLAGNALKVGRGDLGPGGACRFGRSEVSGTGRIMLFGALLAAGTGIAVVHAQTVLGDPRDAARTFASNCSACHKSPRGLAKSGQIAGFLRQHYTTGPEMSAAMAAYLVSAGSAPEPKKGPASADAAKTKSKKGEQLAAQPHAERAEAIQPRTLRG